MDVLLFHKDNNYFYSTSYLFIFKFVMKVLMLSWGGVHYISNASSILLFNILYAFALITIILCIMNIEINNLNFTDTRMLQ